MSLFRNIIILILLSTVVYGQQDPQYSQYMHNTAVLNPAFTGALGRSVVTAVERIQWVGLEGAPHTQTLAYHTIIEETNFGVGGNIINDAIGPLNEVYFDGMASYAVLLSNKVKLAFGVKIGGHYFSVDKSKIILDNQNDIKLNGEVNKLFFSIGTGLYLNTQRFYIGLSVPNLVPSRVYSGDIQNGSLVKMNYQMFIMSGYAFTINELTRLKPAMLIKIAEGLPTSIDLSANVLYDRFHLGISHRVKDSFTFSAGFDINENFFIGYAYDLTSSRFSVTNSGSHEIILKYKGRSKVSTTAHMIQCHGGGLAWF